MTILGGLPLDMEIFLLLINYIQLLRSEAHGREIQTAKLQLGSTGRSSAQARQASAITYVNAKIFYFNLKMLTLLALLMKLKYPP